MSNSSYGKVWIADTLGIITREPITIQTVVMFPNAAADVASFYYWDRSDTISGGVGGSHSVNTDISGNNTITVDSGAYLPSTITDGSIFELVHSDGLAVNLNREMLVHTGGSDTAVVIHKIPDQWTDEANVHYHWKTYQNRLAFHLISSAQKDQVVINFGPNGFRFPNLALESITSAGSTKVYLYIK